MLDQMDEEELAGERTSGWRFWPWQANELDKLLSAWGPVFDRRPVRIAAGVALGVFLVLLGVFAYYYVHFAQLIDARLAKGPFSQAVNIFTAPRTIAEGDSLTLAEAVESLRRNGITPSHNNPLGWYNLRPHAVEIFPGRDSFPGEEPALIEFAGGKISRIVSLQDNTERPQIEFDAQLIANLSPNREKRRLVRFKDIPPNLVNAVISAEDKRFFHHTGFDVTRILKAAYVDLKDGRKAQGASTLTMQLARSFFLDSDKRWKRKLAEILITMHLEHKLTKQQIFEDYANQVYLGQSGTYSINGFGEAARIYYGEDLSQLTDSQAAMLAGMIQRPSFFNPYRYPGRVRERRDIVLGLMRANGYLNDSEYRQAVSEPLKVKGEQNRSVQDQYFADLMNDELQAKLDDHAKQTRYIYTTLDPDLQAAADDAVRIGMQNVDQQLRRPRGRKPIPAGQPQAALIALDPHTGEIKALVGGRNYQASQLNHALAMRQPGSVFKPFVYAAALDTAIQGGQQIFTPASILNDEPTTFLFGSTSYQPNNFGHTFMGEVTLRAALAHSLNVATVSLAEQVGYARVVELARRAGLNNGIQPTPAVALGAYEATPLEIAEAYTAFANYGMRVSPTTISLVRAADGTGLYIHRPDPTFALDRRVTYLTVDMMEDVLRSGTGADVRARGFTLPAAGKTGTSHDGWFAGFTSELLCIVWVGFDDNRDLGLEGAHSALPIWTEFMKRASKMRAYRDAKPFTAPPGIVSATICDQSGQLAGAMCPNKHTEMFIDGTQPAVECQLHSGAAAQQIRDRVAEPSVKPAGATGEGGGDAIEPEGID
jgi:penicillin-binding protein 1B